MRLLKLLTGIGVAVAGGLAIEHLINKENSIVSKTVQSDEFQELIAAANEKLELLKSKIRALWVWDAGDPINSADLEDAVRAFKETHMILHPDEELTDDDVYNLVFSM